MANGNVSISSLLAENQEDSVPLASAAMPRPKGAAVRNLVSRFQTSLKVGGPESPIIVVDDDLEPPAPSPFTSTTPTPAGSGKSPSLAASPSSQRKVLPIRPSPGPAGGAKAHDPTKASRVTSHVKNFQTNFTMEPQAPLNRTSINSIINIESSPESEGPMSPEKRKNVKSTPLVTKRKSPEEESSVAKKKRPTNKSKKIADAISAEKQEKEQVDLAPPSMLDVEKPKPKDDKRENESKEAEKDKKELEKKEKEKKDLPIIALNIPLIDPKNPKGGQSEVIVNVLKLAEEKYGWAALHPNAKNAIDVMDDLIEDDDDVEEDDDELVEVDNSASGAVTATVPAPAATTGTKSKGKKEEELTEEQLVRRHEAKMNRKVGKYDYEDPFIDDDELQWEEEISSTKEGFFVYWGPLIDERHPVAIKKSQKKR